MSRSMRSRRRTFNTSRRVVTFKVTGAVAAYLNSLRPAERERFIYAAIRHGVRQP